MSLNDPLSNMLSKILNAERTGKEEIIVKPYSKVIKEVLKVLQENNYVSSYEDVDDGRGGFLKVSIENINNCGVIKPRFAVKINGFERFEKRFLPAKDFGILIVSTSKGIVTHNQAKEAKTGGKLIAYCY